MLNWKSESKELPKVGQSVFFASPRQTGEVWDIRVMQLVIRHEGVLPRPVTPGGAHWPTEYYWGAKKSPHEDIVMVTGNGWWASMSDIPLPPGAVHDVSGGRECIRQIGNVFIPQNWG